MMVQCPIQRVCAKTKRICREIDYSECDFYKACLLKKQKKRTRQ